MLTSFPELRFEKPHKTIHNDSLFRQRTPVIIANNPFEQSLLDFLRDESQNRQGASPKSLTELIYRAATFLPESIKMQLFLYSSREASQQEVRLTEAVKIRYRYTITQSVHFTKLLRCQGLFDKMAAILASIGASNTNNAVVPVPENNIENIAMNSSNAIASNATVSANSVASNEGNDAPENLDSFGKLSQNLSQVETLLQQSIVEISRLRQMLEQQQPALDRIQTVHELDSSNNNGDNVSRVTVSSDSDSSSKHRHELTPTVAEKKRKSTASQKEKHVAEEVSQRQTRRQKLK
jgi:hypothetical protein